jgi:hypothetical protein
MANEFTDVRTALARAVAERRISDDIIDTAAKHLATAKHPIRGINVCERGICIDYFLDTGDWWQTLPELITIEGGRLAGIEIFPWGIPKPDIFHIRVAQELDGMA